LYPSRTTYSKNRLDFRVASFKHRLIPRFKKLQENFCEDLRGNASTRRVPGPYNSYYPLPRRLCVPRDVPDSPLPIFRLLLSLHLYFFDCGLCFNVFSGYSVLLSLSLSHSFISGSNHRLACRISSSLSFRLIRRSILLLSPDES
jgi:hypothetical protein